MFCSGDFFSLDKEYASFRQTLSENLALPHALPIVVNGLSAGAELAFFLIAVRDALRFSGSAPVLVLVESEAVGEKTAKALQDSGIRAMHYKERDLVFHNITASHDTERERLLVLSALLSGECQCVVATLYAASLITLPVALLQKHSVDLSLGVEIPPVTLARTLDTLGFIRVDMVESAGQFSVRGGIVDIYTEAQSEPVRIEFFGDEIDRMEYFNPITQRVSKPCERLTLRPAEEVLVGEEGRERMLAVQKKLLSKATESDVRAKITREYEMTKEGLSLPFRDKYLGILYPEHTTLFDYLTTRCESLGAPRFPIFIRGTQGVRESLEKREALIRGEGETMLSLGAISKDCAHYVNNYEHLAGFVQTILPSISIPSPAVSVQCAPRGSSASARGAPSPTAIARHFCLRMCARSSRANTAP